MDLKFEEDFKVKCDSNLIWLVAVIYYKMIFILVVLDLHILVVLDLRNAFLHDVLLSRLAYVRLLFYAVSATMAI